VKREGEVGMYVVGETIEAKSAILLKPVSLK